ncbi:MAG: hypothetical protein ACRCXZ_06425 [Patescibacteria group bacterium]
MKSNGEPRMSLRNFLKFSLYLNIGTKESFVRSGYPNVQSISI